MLDRGHLARRRRDGGTGAGQVEVHWERADDHIAIAVHDTGVGIAREQLDRVFVPFDRLDADITSVEGTGLGLALTAYLAELHHGRVEVSSEPGVGSVFTVTLPAADEPPVDIEPPRRDSPPAVSSASGTVLYIEDRPSNVELVRRVLARRRPAVQLLDASDGPTGLALLHEHQPDLVLLDLQLPGDSGRDVLTGLRNDPNTTHTAVVIVTGDLAAGHPDQLQEMGADGFLAKPFDLARLLEVIDTTLEGSRP